jgi:hypothetical protein
MTGRKTCLAAQRLGVNLQRPMYGLELNGSEQESDEVPDWRGFERLAPPERCQV